MTTGLQLNQVFKAWHGFALQDITLEIENGEYFVLLGPTGSGKTLLLEVIMGFHKVTHGTIVLEGQDITNIPPEKRKLGYVPQSGVLFSHLTVYQNIEFGLKMRGIPASERQKTAEPILETLELSSLTKRHPTTLSGGEQQKVALARVLVLEPRMILLDEPLSNVDAEARRGLQEELKRIHREFHVTFLHVTHDQMDAFSLADRVAVMKAGQIAQVGSAQELFAQPRDEFIARFLGYENIYQARVIGHHEGRSQVEVQGVRFWMAESVELGPCVIGIRSDAILLARTYSPAARQNTFPGVMTDYLDLGPIVTVCIDIGIPIKAMLTKREFLEMQDTLRDEIHLQFAASSVKALE